MPTPLSVIPPPLPLNMSMGVPAYPDMHMMMGGMPGMSMGMGMGMPNMGMMAPPPPPPPQNQGYLGYPPGYDAFPGYAMQQPPAPPSYGMMPPPPPPPPSMYNNQQ